MNFWDSSAILPLIVNESYTPVIRKIVASDAEMIVWWATPVECVSALARLEREGTLSLAAMEVCLQRLADFQQSWYEIQPNQVVREMAVRLLRTHTLRSADALQLSAAICAAENRPSTLPMICLDTRLCTAARKEGFSILPDIGVGPS